jgi:ribonuclease D
VSYEQITTDRRLMPFCEELATWQSIALDTEFVAEYTYRPQLCLVQVAAGERMTVIDPLAVEDMTPFWRVLAEGDHDTIVHAGRGELEFCLHAVGRCPRRMFDVQIAAGLVGVEYPAGYSTLLSRLLGESPKRRETRTDWRRRPLSKRQIEYALDDVRYLCPLRDVLRGRLEELGRLPWLEDELRSWQEEIERAASREQWRRVSGNSGLGPRSLAIVRELWRWREAEAQRRNCPPRRVLRDDLIIELAKRQTADLKRIRAVRGMNRRDLNRALPQLAQRVERALALPESELPRVIRRSSAPQLAVLGQFLASALASISRQAQLAPALLGTPSDVREYVAYRLAQENASSREPPLLARGWRAEIIGKVFDDLLAGKLAIRIADPSSDRPLVFEPVDTQPED